MALLFDPRSGSDRVETGATVNAPASWTAYMWFRRSSGTSGSFFCLHDGVTPILEAYISASTTDRIGIERKTSGTTGVWRCIVADQGVTHSASDWIFLAITQSGTSTPAVYTASPKQSVTIGSRTVSVGTSPTGTETTTANCTMQIGNALGETFSMGGDIAWFGFHSVVLTAGEIEEAMWRGLFARSLVLGTTLENSSSIFDLSGSDLTLTGTGVSTTSNSEPPVIPYWISVFDGNAQSSEVSTGFSGLIPGVGSLNGDIDYFASLMDGAVAGVGSFSANLTYIEPVMSGTISGFSTFEIDTPLATRKTVHSASVGSKRKTITPVGA